MSDYYFFSRTPPANCTTYSLLYASSYFASGLRAGFLSILFRVSWSHYVTVTGYNGTWHIRDTWHIWEIHWKQMCCGVGFCFFKDKSLILCNFSLLFTCIAVLFDLVWVGKHYVKPAKVFLGVIPSLHHVSHTPYFWQSCWKFLWRWTQSHCPCYWQRSYSDSPLPAPGMTLVSGFHLDISHWLQLFKCDLPPAPYPLSVASIKSTSLQCRD